MPTLELGNMLLAKKTLMSFCLMDPIKQSDISTARKISNGENSCHCLYFILRIWKGQFRRFPWCNSWEAVA
jgi:hypothetical protein